MKRIIVVIPGDGIGEEITPEVCRIIKAVRPESFHFLKIPVLSEETLPKVVAAIKECGVALKGPTMTPGGGGHRSFNVALRMELGLYANIRPIATLPYVPTRFSDIRMAIIRENTEDLYIGEERVIKPGVVHATKRITKSASERIASFALSYAARENFTRITAAHKANILKLSDGLFRDSFRRVTANTNGIIADDLYIDDLCCKLVMKPERFGIIVTTNLYGDIVSDLAAGLIGGLGVAASANIGDKYSVFEAVHGTAPDIAGKGIANPLGLLFSACLLLEHIGDKMAAQLIRTSVGSVISSGVKTQDLGGSATTKHFADAIIETIAYLTSRS